MLFLRFHREQQQPTENKQRTHFNLDDYITTDKEKPTDVCIKTEMCMITFIKGNAYHKVTDWLSYNRKPSVKNNLHIFCVLSMFL